MNQQHAMTQADANRNQYTELENDLPPNRIENTENHDRQCGLDIAINFNNNWKGTQSILLR